MLKHLADFLKLLEVRERHKYLPKLAEFLKMDNDRNWRFRLGTRQPHTPVSYIPLFNMLHFDMSFFSTRLSCHLLTFFLQLVSHVIYLSFNIFFFKLPMFSNPYFGE